MSCLEAFGNYPFTWVHREQGTCCPGVKTGKGETETEDLGGSPRHGPGGSSLRLQRLLSLLPVISPDPPSPCLFAGHL